MPIIWLQRRPVLSLLVLISLQPSSVFGSDAKPMAVAVGVTVSREIQTSERSAEEQVVLPGVVIEEIPKGSALEKAGLQVGDVILSWERLPSPPANPESARGELTSCFSWLTLEIEHVPRGVVVLKVHRGDIPLEVVVKPGFWDARVQSRLPQSLGAVYLEGKRQLAEGDIDAVARIWQALKYGLLQGGNKGTEILLSLQVAALRDGQVPWDKAVEGYGKALESTEDPAAKAWILVMLAEVYERQDDYKAAEAVYSLALDTFQKLNGESLSVASVQNRLGEVTRDTGNLDTAHELFSKSLEVSERLAPQSLPVAAVLNNLGVEARLRGDLHRAEDLFLRSFAIREVLAPDSLYVAESLNNIANILGARSDLDSAYIYDMQALQLRQGLAPDGLEVASSLNNLGVLASKRGQLDVALGYHCQALEIRQKLAPGSLVLASTFNNIGLVFVDLGNLGEARSYIVRSLEIRENLAPASLATASALNSMGELAWRRGELSAAEEYFDRSLDIRRRITSESLEEAVILNNLGVIATVRGDLSRAEELFMRALQIRQRRASGSLHVAQSLQNLGALSQGRGELDHAYDYYRQALEIYEKSTPESLSYAHVLCNLGSLMQLRGELSRAHALYEQALQIQEKQAKQGFGVASTLNSLGTVAQEGGDLLKAEKFYTQAVGIYEQAEVQNLNLASVLNNLSTLRQLQGRSAEALMLSRESLDIKEKIIPQSLGVSLGLNNLGNLAYLGGDLDSAYKYHLQAMKIVDVLAPGTLGHSISLHGLSAVARARQDYSGAYSYLTQAIDTLEHQSARLGGAYHVQAAFKAHREKYYYDILDVLLAQGRVHEAFFFWERFRAQTFLAMLAERDIAFSADIPVELEQDRRRLSMLYDHALKKLTALSARDGADEIDAVRKELRRLDSEAGDIEFRIRRVSPRLAALQYPAPLKLTKAREALDSGTLLLSYSVGDKNTILFVLSRSEELEVRILPFGEQYLQSRVERLLELIHQGGQSSSLEPLRQRQMQAVSRGLYVGLLEPVAERITRSERLLILPDGPLHSLPFAALVRSDSAGRQGGSAKSIEYLSEWKPLHVALSVTVFSELKRGRHSSSDDQERRFPIQLTAFGDPLYPQIDVAMRDRAVSLRAAKADDALPNDSPADPVFRSAADRGILDWLPLPYTRREVESIARLFSAGTVRTFLGPEAIEDKLKSLDPKTRILHLAAHGFIDKHLPSSSFIALTIPEDPTVEGAGPKRENGLLQVWEILERVRLDSELVVLSACETAQGKELGGEGLIGLTRAFQYAGARTVVASLWSVQDLATSELMIRFYKHLRAGLSKDEALRQAQLELIRGPIEVINEKGEKTLLDASAPYYWAGFQVYGDWQ